MEYYKAIRNYLVVSPIVEKWPEIKSLLDSIPARRSSHLRLPLEGCRAFGGSSDQAVPASAALAAMQSSILLVDDLLDKEDHLAAYYHGSADAANMALALQAIGIQALQRASLSDEIKKLAVWRLSEMMLMVAYGQRLDVGDLSTEEDYWQVARSKSSPFFATALYLGSLMAGASVKAAEAVYKFGCIYGEMIQIEDDLHDALEVPANSDWLQGRSPLPILFAQLVDHPERERFLYLRDKVDDSENLLEAQAILVRCGAISYGIDQLVKRYGEAKQLLDYSLIPQRYVMHDLLENIIMPARQLLTTVGEKTENVLIR